MSALSKSLISVATISQEMECAAVAWVCDNLGVPFAAVKSITDIVDGEKATRAEFESNLHMASCALQERLTDVLLLIGGRPLSVWAGGTHGVKLKEVGRASPLPVERSDRMPRQSSPDSQLNLGVGHTTQNASRTSMSGSVVIRLAFVVIIATLVARARHM